MLNSLLKTNRYLSSLLCVNDLCPVQFFFSDGVVNLVQTYTFNQLYNMADKTGDSTFGVSSLQRVPRY